MCCTAVRAASCGAGCNGKTAACQVDVQRQFNWQTMRITELEKTEAVNAEAEMQHLRESAGLEVEH